MAHFAHTSTTAILAFLILLLLPHSYSSESIFSDEYGLESSPVPDSDVDLLEFPLNLEYLEAEFFLYGSLGFGLDKVAPNLTLGGPKPFGAKKAKLDPFTRDVIEQFAWQEVGHLRFQIFYICFHFLTYFCVRVFFYYFNFIGDGIWKGDLNSGPRFVCRAIKKTVKGFPRPQLDLSAKSFAKVFNLAFGRVLKPPFDPYANSLNYLLASYLIPYVGLTGYVGANPKLQGSTSKRLVAGLLGVESGQDAVIRTLLYKHALVKVHPYDITVAEFTNRLSDLRNKLGQTGLKDEGLLVPKYKGAEGKISGNVLAGDGYSVAYDRTPEEILRIVYGSGDEHVPGGFYPKGADGRIAKSHLQNE
ncbi:hypothetical protein ABKV19_016284 [Rosa sericea]